MQFLLIGTISSAGRASTPEDLAFQKAREEATAQDYYRRGIFRQIWSIDGGAVVVCEVDNRDELESHVAALPLVEVGYLDVTLQELRPYAGLTAGRGPLAPQ